jgi:putative DNA primase/helicase
MSGRDEIRQSIAAARDIDDEDILDDSADAAEPVAPSTLVDEAAVERCAALDLSDTDNGRRLREHFGRDLVVVALDEDAGGVWLTWDGRRWDREEGLAGAMKTAQEVGPRIALEAAYLKPTPEEKRVADAAGAFASDDDGEAAREARAAAKAAKAALTARRRKRWAFATTSKNSARINAMMSMAAPHLRRAPDLFNADPLLVVTHSHSLRFVVEDDLECPDPNVTRKMARVEALAGFRREDFVTGLVPCDYDPRATCPKFLKFLARCMPNAELTRTLKVYSATGLLGRLEQRLAYHYGLGANGKSVFLAVLAAVIGPSLSVGMPKETIMGQGERGAGQASPDLVRLFGRRTVRIDEMKDGEALREELVKRMTGGDPMIVRGLYSGYLEFPNVATPHFSGNGHPKIDGTDEGIWRRIIVLHWSVTIPEAERRDFNEMVADLLTERSGILNWLIEGVLDYLVNGLTIAPSARQATEEYRAEMDPVREFRERCLVERPGGRVQAQRLFQIYLKWAKANNRAEFSVTRFGREVKRCVKRDDRGSARFYIDVELSEGALALEGAPSPPPGEDWRGEE